MRTCDVERVPGLDATGIGSNAVLLGGSGFDLSRAEISISHCTCLHMLEALRHGAKRATADTYLECYGGAACVSNRECSRNLNGKWACQVRRLSPVMKWNELGWAAWGDMIGVYIRAKLSSRGKISTVMMGSKSLAARQQVSMY